MVNDPVVSDERFARLYDVDPAKAAAGEPITEFFAAVHPDDKPGIQELIGAAIATSAPFVGEYRLVQP